MDARFPRRAALVALIATALASAAAWVYDDRVGFDKPFDRIVRDTGVIPAYAISLLIALASSKQGRAWLVQRVPIVSASALGLFRMAFAASLALVVRTIDPSFRPLCFLLLALFAAGVAARVSFAAFVIAFTRAHLGNTTDHAVALPLKTLWLMVVVPWGAGLSVDAAILRRVGWPPPERSRAYGLAMWIPMLMLGLAYAAAAFAKMDDVGPRWVTGGAVRYILLVDGHKAPVAWNRYIIRSDVLSVLFSGLAIAGESAVVLAAIWPTTAVVLAAGLVALGLHVSFYVLQGVWWSLWWMLLPAFVPWEAIASRLRRGTSDAPATTERRLAWAVGLVMFAAVLQQPAASLLRTSYGFAFSDFPMYSNVYLASRAEAIAQQEQVFQPPPIIRFDAPQVDAALRTRIERLDGDQVLTEIVRKIARGEPVTDGDAALVRDAARRHAAEFGEAVRQVEVFADTWRFDWSSADFVPRQQWKPVATISLDRGVIEARKP